MTIPPAKKAFTIIMDCLSLYIPVSFRADSYSVTAPEQGRPRSTHLHALLLSCCLLKRGKPARFGLLRGVKPGPKTKHLFATNLLSLQLCMFILQWLDCIKLWQDLAPVLQAGTKVMPKSCLRYTRDPI